MNSLGIGDFGMFCMAVLLLNATPGPDTAYIVGRSIAQGRAAGLVSALGISVGCCLHALALALGLSAVLAASPAAFTVIQLAGGIYLVYMGIALLRGRSNTRPLGALRDDRRSMPAIFWQAVATNVLNPKVILFFLSFIPQFVHPDFPHKPAAFLLLGLALALISLVWNSGTAMLAEAVTRHAGQRRQAWLSRLVGVAFILLGARLAFIKN